MPADRALLTAMDRPRKAPDARRRRLGAAAAALVAVCGVGAVLSRLHARLPSVSAEAIWTDRVQRGVLVREVRGPGTLVPERVQIISAVTAGRVERRLVEPGATVGPERVLLELGNLDLERDLLEAERELAAARADHAELEARLERDRLAQHALVVQARTRRRDAERKASADEKLSRQGLLAELDLARSRDVLAEQAELLAVEEKRLEAVTRSIRAGLEAQIARVRRQQGLVDFQRRLVEALRVRSPVDGVLAELRVDEGAWVEPGQALARVVEPGRLKAVLRIAETQAGELTVGLPARIDTGYGVVAGEVSRVDPAVEEGTVKVDIALRAGDLPAGVRPDLTVEGRVEMGRMEKVLHLARPAAARPGEEALLFRLLEGGSGAERVRVRLGAGSVSRVEVVEGLREGDVVIVSDLPGVAAADRIRIDNNP